METKVHFELEPDEHRMLKRIVGELDKNCRIMCNGSLRISYVNLLTDEEVGFITTLNTLI